ncbi:helicase-related protein [Shewanella glacialimarina]|uniref:helicase-related protein n=1 Tax=Shewanella glacialimarina TaxID=2590884 RepID=UPI001CF91D3F|nr:helicase-related protein [Shewanella glacialimarina]
MSMEDFESARQQLLNYVSKQLVGPWNGEHELLSDAPHKRYLAGTLFPPAVLRDELDESDSEDSTTEALSNDFKPSSMALSFAAQSSSIFEIEITAGGYSKDQQKEWQRKPLHHVSIVDLSATDSLQKSIFNNGARLDVAIRPYVSGKIITIAVSNQSKSGEQLDPSDCLYQCQIKVATTAGSIIEYPSSDRFKLDDEQKELALTYRKRIPWAVGHGVAVDWYIPTKSNTPTTLITEVIPHYEVKGFTTELDQTKVSSLAGEMLSIHRIADIDNVSATELLSDYTELADVYSHWIDELEAELLDPRYLSAKERIILRLRVASKRMYSGIERLAADEPAMKAFRLANKAMLMQMIHSGSKYSGSSKSRNWGYETPEYFGSEILGKFNWRPFQLAFQLLVLESLIPDKEGHLSSSHDDVDLLWFPTGGGKTEAYLAVAAWEMIYRRLKFGEMGGGTSVIKRYTLRLLTSQQFQRAGSLICALEILRQNQPESLGAETFSLGLWVGAASSPNSYQDAHEAYLRERESDQPENPFQLQVCPWCGTSIFPAHHSENNCDYGVKSDPHSHFSFMCPSDTCEFHEHLPVQVVDDALYCKPPSLLIGTIDKFARLTWKSEASAFFGNGKVRSPGLIIQDELHLISGPLGTIAGIYEAGFDSIMEILGAKPKIIAATATIRSANYQVNRLFGRNVSIFPPSGTDESDSFFSKEDKDNPGRLYVGVMPAGHTGQTGLVQLGASLIQAPQHLGFKDLILDSYWTLPIYHNSRRELGKTMTLSRDDIPARVGVIAEDKKEIRDIQLVEELSANVKGPRIPEVLAKLDKGVTHPDGAIDILPCTNMISVGVDIGRLGMMLIAGQPKATSEYIQASSRVGRSKKRPPGIVFTQYSATKPRDRSHYESFKSYHQALYRYVEPTSVTPWAMPAVERALHASLIAVVRMTGYLRENKSVRYFNKDSAEFINILGVFKERIKASMVGMDQREKQKVFDYLDSLIDQWSERVNSQKSPVQLYENGGAGKQFEPLFKSFDSDKHDGAWKTLNSMRSVDTETHILVRGEKND